MKSVYPIFSCVVHQTSEKLSLIIALDRRTTRGDPRKTNYSVNILVIYPFMFCNHCYRAILRARVIDLADTLIINDANSIIRCIPRYQFYISYVFGGQTRHHFSVRMVGVPVRIVTCGAFLCKNVCSMSSGVDYKEHISLICPLKRISSPYSSLCQERPPIVHQ